MFGGKAIPPRATMDYPVNTVVLHDSSQVSYRVEWGLIREEVSKYQMQRRFDPGTSFRVTGVQVKDDRLELNLQSASSDSAKLKLMLGAGWQSKLDLQAVQSQLSRIFVFDQPQQPKQQVASATTVSTITPPVAGTTSATNTPAPGTQNPTANSPDTRPDNSAQHPSPGTVAASNAAAIPGRLSSDQMKAILAQADEESRRTFSDLVQQTSGLSTALLSMQKSGPQYDDKGLCEGKISKLQLRLGMSLSPKQVDDINEMDEVLRRCAGIYGMFKETEQIRVSTYQAIQVASPRLQQIESARSAILDVEGALDKFDLVTRSNVFKD
jgi:hypothetical protein